MLYSLLMTWRKTVRDWQKLIHENTKSCAVLDGEITTCLQDGKMFNKPCYLGNPVSWDHSKWVQCIICNTYVLKCLIVCSDGGHIFSWNDDVITSSFQRMFKTRKSLKVLTNNILNLYAGLKTHVCKFNTPDVTGYSNNNNISQFFSQDGVQKLNTSLKTGML